MRASPLDDAAFLTVEAPEGVAPRFHGAAPLDAPREEVVAATRGVTVEELERPYRRALVISLLNPKAILFFIAFFVQFVDPAYAHPALSFLFLGVLAEIASALYLSALIFGGARLAATFRRRRGLAAGGTSAVATVFLGFAVKLSLAHG